MAEAIKITEVTLPAIQQKLQLAIDAEKDFQVVIQLHNKSLKARQRALANIWYKQIGDHFEEPMGWADAYCKYNFGFKIRCESDHDLEVMIRKMLDGHDYEQKLEIIRVYSEFFPILRDKNGMTSDQQGRYLHEIQRNLGREGCFLTSPKEEGLIAYPESR